MKPFRHGPRRSLSVLIAVLALVSLSTGAAAGGEPPPPDLPPTPPIPPPVGGPHPFTDTYFSAFQVEIAWLYNSGITGGCSSTTFCPTAPVNREQMASFLVRGLGLPASGTDAFGDDNASLHQGDINALAASGITGGCGPGRFCPTNPVTREQMASFLVRALGLPPSATNHFSDDSSSIHQADINALASSGITGGCAADRFCPSDAVNREQMAAFLFRALAASVASTLLPADGPATNGGGSVSGAGLPSPPYSVLGCFAGHVRSGPTIVFDNLSPIGQPPNVIYWVPLLFGWTGTEWTLLAHPGWHYSYVYSSNTSPGHGPASANPPWYQLGGTGQIGTDGYGWNVTPGFSYAVVNVVQSTFGENNAAVALTGYTSGAGICNA